MDSTLQCGLDESITRTFSARQNRHCEHEIRCPLNRARSQPPKDCREPPLFVSQGPTPPESLISSNGSHFSFPAHEELRQSRCNNLALASRARGRLSPRRCRGSGEQREHGTRNGVVGRPPNVLGVFAPWACSAQEDKVHMICGRPWGAQRVLLPPTVSPADSGVTDGNQGGGVGWRAPDRNATGVRILTRSAGLESMGAPPGVISSSPVDRSTLRRSTLPHSPTNV